jgi:hypothetical protein
MSNNGYLGNRLLKGTNTAVQYTHQQVQEYMKCAEDPEYFIEKYIKIVHVDRGLINLKMHEFQMRIVKEIHQERFVVCKIPRQMGKTTIMVAYLLHYCLFNPDVRVAILANKASTAREILDRFKLAYEHLPAWLQQGIKEWNKLSIELENGAKIITSPTSGAAVRGFSFNIIVLDEFAFVQQHIADEFIASIFPTISSGQTTKMIVISTPNGMNHYHKLWIDAKNNKNGYKPIEAKWNEIPGRNDAFKKLTIAQIGETKWNQEFECQFLGSQHTLIAAQTIAEMVSLDPIYYNNEGLVVYEEPKQNHIYMMTVDCGKGNAQDYHAFSVFDCTHMPYKQVAVFRNNVLPYQMLPSHVEKIAKKYNESHVLFELNDLGMACADILADELEYENIVYTSAGGKSKMGQRADGGIGAAGGGRSQRGVNMSGRVKKEGCSLLKSMIESGRMDISDYNTIAEFSTYIAVKDSFKADEGYNDDIITTMVLFCWLTAQSYFKDITDTDLRKKLYERELQKLEEEVLPFGFIVDGVNEIETDDVDVFDERSSRERQQDFFNSWKDSND